MSQWITDRLPTEADADVYGEVWDCYGELAFWTDIEEHQPWHPTNCPGKYVQPTRFTVHWYDNVRMWGVKDSQDDERGLQSNFDTKEAAERIAAVYNEVMP